jgi:hypothetical protein
METLVLENCPRLRPQQVLPDPDEAAKTCQALRLRIEGLEARLRDLAEQIDNFEDQIGRTSDPVRRDRYEDRIRKLEEAARQLREEKTQEGKKLEEAERSQSSFTRWQRDLASLRKALKTGDVEVRLKTRAHLRELIEKVEVFAVGFAEHGERDTNTDADAPDDKDYLAADLLAVAAEEDPTLSRDRVFRAFLTDLTERRMSKEGRFLRVHFKTGLSVDLVPQGSLATGWRLAEGGDWEAVSHLNFRDDWERLRAEHSGKSTKKSRKTAARSCQSKTRA